MKLVFCLIILVWLFVGFLGLLHCKKNRVNYEMIAFVLFSLFVPLIAKACGLI
jgi:hypothetical protein